MNEENMPIHAPGERHQDVIKRKKPIITKKETILLIGLIILCLITAYVVFIINPLG